MPSPVHSSTYFVRSSINERKTASRATDRNLQHPEHPDRKSKAGHFPAYVNLACWPRVSCAQGFPIFALKDSECVLNVWAIEAVRDTAVHCDRRAQKTEQQMSFELRCAAFIAAILLPWSSPLQGRDQWERDPRNHIGLNKLTLSSLNHRPIYKTSAWRRVLTLTRYRRGMRPPSY